MTHGKWEFFFRAPDSFALGMFESTYASCARLVIQLLYKIIPPWKTNKFLAPEMMVGRLPSKDSCSITGKFASTIFHMSNFAVQLPSSTYQQSLGIQQIHQGPQLLTPGSGWCACGRGENRKWKLEILLSQRGYRDFLLEVYRYAACIYIIHPYTFYTFILFILLILMYVPTNN